MMSKSAKPIVMAIDDDPVILNFIASALVSDYHVRPFTSEKTALDFLSCNSTDIILLDCQMPDATGYEVLTALHAVPRLCEIPVIFSTSSVDSDSEIMALELGAVDYRKRDDRHAQGADGRGHERLLGQAHPER